MYLNETSKRANWTERNWLDVLEGQRVFIVTVRYRKKIRDFGCVSHINHPLQKRFLAFMKTGHAFGQNVTIFLYGNGCSLLQNHVDMLAPRLMMYLPRDVKIKIICKSQLAATH
jgi:hypothetical protein